jgi:hypothetical protein
MPVYGPQIDFALPGFPYKIYDGSLNTLVNVDSTGIMTLTKGAIAQGPAVNGPIGGQYFKIIGPSGNVDFNPGIALQSLDTGGRTWDITSSSGFSNFGQGSLAFYDETLAAQAVIFKAVSGGGAVSIGPGTPSFQSTESRLRIIGLAADNNPSIAIENHNTGGRNWDIISSGGGSGAGQGKMAFFDETAGAYIMYLSSTNGLEVQRGIGIAPSVGSSPPAPNWLTDGTNIFLQASNGDVFLRPIPGTNRRMLYSQGQGWRTTDDSGVDRNLLDANPGMRIGAAGATIPVVYVQAAMPTEVDGALWFQG